MMSEQKIEKNCFYTTMQQQKTNRQPNFERDQLAII